MHLSSERKHLTTRAVIYSSNCQSVSQTSDLRCTFYWTIWHAA